MILISTEDLLSSKYSDMILMQCDKCNKKFERKCKDVKSHLKSRPKGNHFCSKTCLVESKFMRVHVQCKQCNKPVLKAKCELKRSSNSFCNRSCARIYNNAHKIYGCRRSKVEIFLEKSLIEIYPNLEFHFNRKDAINSELDIYIPSLKLAFELNGIFHYEPIYGKDKLNQIKNNDSRKFQACLEQNIELCILDVSSITYFKPEKVKKYLYIITDIINNKLK